MKKALLWFLAIIITTLQLSPVLAADRFGPALGESVDSIKQNVDISFPTQNGIWGASGARDFIIYIVKKIITPIMIFIGILLGIIGMYDIITSTKDDGAKKGFNYILWWALWIIVMVSANFLANTLVNWWIFMYDPNGQLLGSLTAQRIYERILFPFLKLFMYIIIWVLFVLALIRLVWMLTSEKEEAEKWARTIIIWNALGILTIIFAKQIIETIYGLQSEVVSTTDTNLWQIWEWILANKQIPFVYTVINYIISFIWLFLLVMIIIQAVQLLTKPTDEAMQKKLRKNFIYMLIGLGIIGTAYVITNVLIVK